MFGKASIFLPVQMFDYEHAALKQTLASAFGEVTATPDRDMWRDAETGKSYCVDSIRYTVEAEWTGRLPGRLQNIAAHTAMACGLECVTVEHVDGSQVEAFYTPVALEVEA